MMESYSSKEVFSDNAKIMMRWASNVVAMLPDGLRCHEVVRIVQERLCDLGKTMIVDGHYGPIDHSWLVVPNAPMSKAVILDPYCVGRLPQVQLITVSLSLAKLYRPGVERADIDWLVVNREIDRIRRLPHS